MKTAAEVCGEVYCWDGHIGQSLTSKVTKIISLGIKISRMATTHLVTVTEN